MKNLYVVFKIKLYIKIEKDTLLSYEKTDVDTLIDIIVIGKMI